MFGAKKADVDSPKYSQMYQYAQLNDDMPDGAFFAMAEEMHGWDTEDWGWFSEVMELSEKQNDKKS